MPNITTSLVNGTYYRKTGNGPAVFLIHGFPECGVMWQNIWPELSKNYTVFIPDLPGSGDSPLVGAVNMEEMADRIKDIIVAEKLNKVVITGHSMGGYVAFAFARKYPMYVSGLSLVHSTPIADDEERVKIRKKAIEIINNGGKQLFLRQLVNGLFSEGFKLNHQNVVETQIDNACKMSDEGIVNFYNAMILRADTSGILPEALFPIQWVLGAQDNVIPFKKLIPFCYQSGVNFVSFYNDCAHMSMFEAPEKLSADLSQFILYCYTVK